MDYVISELHRLTHELVGLKSQIAMDEKCEKPLAEVETITRNLDMLRNLLAGEKCILTKPIGHAKEKIDRELEVCHDPIDGGSSTAKAASETEEAYHIRNKTRTRQELILLLGLEQKRTSFLEHENHILNIRVRNLEKMNF